MTDFPSTLAAVAASSDQALALDAALLARATQMASDLAVNLTIAALIIVATWFGSKWAAGAARRALGNDRHRTGAE